MRPSTSTRTVAAEQLRRCVYAQPTVPRQLVRSIEGRTEGSHFKLMQPPERTGHPEHAIWPERLVEARQRLVADDAISDQFSDGLENRVEAPIGQHRFDHRRRGRTF